MSCTFSAEVETALSGGHETEKQTHQDHKVKLWSATPLLGKFTDTNPEAEQILWGWCFKKRWYPRQETTFPTRGARTRVRSWSLAPESRDKRLSADKCPDASSSFFFFLNTDW